MSVERMRLIGEIPPWMHREFPIEKYAAILVTGKAAASQRRYDTREAATADAQSVTVSLRYYRQHYPDLAPPEFGCRVWESKEDGRYRWAILPEPVVKRIRERRP